MVWDIKWLKGIAQIANIVASDWFLTISMCRECDNLYV